MTIKDLVRWLDEGSNLNNIGYEGFNGWGQSIKVVVIFLSKFMSKSNILVKGESSVYNHVLYIYICCVKIPEYSVLIYIQLY